MKKLTVFLVSLFAGFVLSSCQSGEEENNVRSAKLHVSVSPFELEMNDFSSVGQKGVTATDAGVKYIALAVFDSEGNKKASKTQASTEENFGEFDVELDFGTYTFVAVGAKLEGINIESTAKVSFNGALNDTFSGTKSVTVGSSSAQNVTMDLSRYISYFSVSNTNILPSSVKKIQIVVAKGGTACDPATGLAVGTNYTYSKNVLSTAAGTSYPFYLFLTEADETVDVIVNGLDDGDNVLYTQTLKDVPLKQNRKTIATGPLFSKNTTGSFTFSADWDTPSNYAW